MNENDKKLDDLKGRPSPVDVRVDLKLEALDVTRLSFTNGELRLEGDLVADRTFRTDKIVVTESLAVDCVHDGRKSVGDHERRYGRRFSADLTPAIDVTWRRTTLDGVPWPGNGFFENVSCDWLAVNSLGGGVSLPSFRGPLHIVFGINADILDRIAAPSGFRIARLSAFFAVRFYGQALR